MEIISKNTSVQTLVTGMKSDGSDRQEIEATSYIVVVKDGYRTLQMKFDHDPSDDNIMARIENGVYVDITNVEDRLPQLDEIQNTVDLLLLKQEGII